MNSLQNLYRDALRRHASCPVGYRRDIVATHRYEGHNPQCGDRVEILLKLADGMIEDIAFDGEACTICMASASLLCKHLAGQPVVAVDTLAESLESALKGKEQPGDNDPLAPLYGVRPYPTRIQCAMLPWETSAQALESPV